MSGQYQVEQQGSRSPHEERLREVTLHFHINGCLTGRKPRTLFVELLLNVGLLVGGANPPSSRAAVTNWSTAFFLVGDSKHGHSKK